MQYSLSIHTNNGTSSAALPYPFPAEGERHYTFGCIQVTAAFQKKQEATLVTFTASSKEQTACYLSLCGEGDGTLFSFEGVIEEEHILRQSPHDVEMWHIKMDGSAVPMVAVSNENGAALFISDNPAHCDNYTTQHFLPKEKKFYLSSGDCGGSPNFEGQEFSAHYHKIGGEKTHIFRFFSVQINGAPSVKRIRRAAFSYIDKVFGEGSDRLYHSLCFSGNYMHYRRNESGTSRCWIVPGIQYANAQYSRDSYYQTWILPVDMETECYNAFREENITDAEYPCLYLIWSYRIHQKGGSYNKELTRRAYEILLFNMQKKNDGGYYPNCRETGAFRNWFDICCYALDDVDAYSQGLCVTALRAASELGFPSDELYERAKAKYLSLFNGEFIPMSEKKPYLAVDYSVGDVLHTLFFGEPFIPDEMVKKTYSRVMQSAANTSYGVKVISDENGEFLPMEAYGANGFVHPEMKRMESGRYANGGSYHLYEMLFHIHAHLHHIPEAVDNMINRLAIDLNYDGATHEYTHTVTGFCGKANQGWNAAVYAIWDTLCQKGKGDDRFFDAAEKMLREIE